MLHMTKLSMMEMAELKSMEGVELEPVFDSRKSFYGKAVVIDCEGVRYLKSYDTIVAQIEGDEAEIFGTYSPTTLRHIKDFLHQNDFEIGTKKQLETMYIK
jgi:hypothetical protein